MGRRRSNGGGEDGDEDGGEAGGEDGGEGGATKYVMNTRHDRGGGGLNGRGEAVVRWMEPWRLWRGKRWHHGKGGREKAGGERRCEEEAERGWRKVLAVAETVRVEEREAVTREAVMERDGGEG